MQAKDLKINLSAKTTSVLLIIALLIGCFLRVVGLEKNLFFSFEQGRDILKVKEIVEGNLTLIGPRTNIEGVFHGPFIYYFMIPFYLIFSGNPLGVMTPFILFGLGSIYLSYLVGKSFFNQYVGLMAAFLCAVSYKAIVYSRWLSNPPPAFFFSLLLFYSLYRLVSGNSRLLILSIIAFALIFQSEIAAAVFLIPALLVIWLWFRPAVREKNLQMAAFLTLFFSFSSYLLFDFRHQFLTTKSVFRFMANRDNIYRFSLVETLRMIFNRYVGEFRMMLLPHSMLMAVLLLAAVFLLLLLRIKKAGFFSKKMMSEKILFLWLVSAPPLGLFVWGGLHLEYYMVAVAPGMIVATAFFIYWLINKKGIYCLAGVFLFVFCLISNLYAWRIWLPENKDVFYFNTQTASLLGQEKKVVDYIYQEAAGKEFSYQAFTIPYSMEHAWEYLFWWYGQGEYDYLSAHTSSQPGLFYLILEPGGDQWYRQNWIRETVIGKELLKTEEFEGITVESYFEE